MFGSHPSRWIIFLVSGALTALGCVGTTDTGQQGETGSLSVDLVLADGLEIDEVGWQITGNGMDMSGDIDVTAPGSTASVEVFGLPPGETDYTVTLTATTTDKEVSCRGSAPFNVEVGQSTDVMVMLNCKKPRTLGGVRVNGKFNICTQLTKAVVSPLQTSVGNDISLSAQAFDEEGDAIHYIWTGDGGSIADPSAASTTYTCQEVGDHTVTIMVTDNDVYCRMATWTIPVTCVDGDGGDLCEDVVCEDDGNECTEAACNPANGACETGNVEDGTECNGGAGACSAGQCVDDNLCEGVDCNDDNECTADACDPADGSCDNTNVDNGTPCNNDEGVCSDGSCVDVNLCEGVVCDDTGNDCTLAMCNNATGECDTMNVTDGTVCNDGLGACSGGVCIDDNLCDGVDCTSANDCVQNGTCDPASGECLPGDPQPVDTACTSNGGTVCDGAGACVACNAASQCPDDGNDCTAAACETNACVQNNVMDGQACDFGGSDGICEAGTCVEAPGCTMDAQCDDGNPCSVGACPDGMCVFSQASDGTACEVSAGVPGTCTAGDCVGLCENVDCSNNNQCRVDPTCDPADGQCKGGSDEPIDTPCDQGGGSVCDDAGTCVECNSDIQCDVELNETCVDNTCMGGAVDPAPQTLDINIACTNSVQPQMSVIPTVLTVDPGPFTPNGAFTASLTGNLNFPQSFLDVATGVLPAGTTTAQIFDLAATVEVRSGATGANVLVPVDPTIPPFCALSFAACVPANNVCVAPGPFGGPTTTPCTSASQCAAGQFCGNAACGTNPLDTCGPIVLLPLSQDANVCANIQPGRICVGGANDLGACTSDADCPGATGFQVQACENTVKLGQLTTFGGCITGDLPLPLGTATGSYTAGASGSDMLFGWLDDVGTSGSTLKQCPDGANAECYSTTPTVPCNLGEAATPVCAYDGPYADGTNTYWSIPPTTFNAPVSPLALKVNAGLLVAINCVMGADISRPECNGTCQGGSNPGAACETNADCTGGGTCGNPAASCGCDDVANCGAILGLTPNSDLITFPIP